MEKAIELHRNMFFVPGLKKPEKHIAKLNKGKFIEKSYLVAFCNDSERLEIFLSYNFLQKCVRQQKFTAVAFFMNENQAFEYIRLLSEISFKKYDCFNPLKTVNELSEEDLNYIGDAFKEGKDE